MKSFSTRKGIMALEGLELDTPPVSTEATPGGNAVVHDPEELVANDLADMSEASAEGDTIDEATTEALEITDTLGGIQGAMTEANERGDGVSAPVAQALSTAIEHFRMRMGFPKGRAFPAMENFGGKMSRKEATALALEGIADTLRNAWAAIIKAIKAAVQWVKDFFTKFKFAAKKLADRADSLNKKAATADIKEGKIGEGKAKTLSQSLSVDGKIPEGKAFVGILTGYIDETEQELKTLYGGASGIIDNVNKLVNRFSAPVSSASVGSDTHGMIANLVGVLFKSTGAYVPPTHEETPPPKGCRHLTRKLPFGGVANYVVIPQVTLEPPEQLEALAHFKMYIAAAGGAEPPAGETTEIDRLLSKDIQTLTEKISRNMRTNVEHERSLKLLEESADKMEKIAKHIGAEKEQSPDLNFLTKLAGIMSKLIQSYVGGFITNNLKYEADVCKHTLDYCEASLA